ncbi:hypothetical protein GTW71_17340 [Streptomyces sp. SID6041]|nr:hypothetical protein [Streptomyces sp. SID6041]
MSYPLEVPKGRAGLEPRLAVTYRLVGGTDEQGVRTLFGGTAGSAPADGKGRVATWAAREFRQ